MILPTTENLSNESDVEQKFLFPFLSAPQPAGLGFPSSAIKTKANIKRFLIGKGNEQKLYYPDYLLVLQGFPLVAVEAKGPGDELEAGYREARLYATELNASFPSGVNPVRYAIATNGNQLWAGPVDSATPTFNLSAEDLHPSSQTLSQLQLQIGQSALEPIATGFAESLTSRPFRKPTRMLGGQSVRNEEIGHNSFGATIALDYRHLFNPTTREERGFIAREAYIPSKRRQRYVDPIDRIIRAAKPPSISDATLIDDTEDPKVLVDRLRDLKPLEQQVLLLIGSVGSGKSTFVDYLTEVGLPEEVLKDTLWIHINMNAAPVSREVIYEWLAQQIIEGCRSAHAEVDHDELANVERVYAVELTRFRKGVGKLFSPEDNEYRTRLADELTRLQNDTQISAKAYSRYWASERGKLLIVVLDNCDKRIRDEQLLMFQAAEWLQREFRVLVILPLRDETYDNHRHEPPLDTALKDLVFRIEPPLFQHVLTRRVQLALKDISTRVKSKTLYYNLPNAMRVEYPADDQAFYLTSILRSLYEHDHYLRRMIVGIAGRDLRHAMEIFLEICHSAHITEDQIFRIRQSEGEYVLPLHLVARVLLRMNRRFYDGDSAYLKNVFALEPSDSYPNYFTRLLILRWLLKRFRDPSATGVQGYKSIKDLKSDLTVYGITETALNRELIFLLRSHCVVAEHLRTDAVADDDLIKLAPAGFVHLESLAMIDYLSAVAEDTWYSDAATAQAIADRIASDAHYSVNTSVQNARQLIDYLQKQQQKAFPSPGAFLSDSSVTELLELTDSVNEVERAEVNRRRRDPWFEADHRYEAGKKYQGVVVNRVDFGLFIELEPGITGLAHRTQLPASFLSDPDYLPGEEVVVSVIDLEPLRGRMSLRVLKE